MWLAFVPFLLVQTPEQFLHQVQASTKRGLADVTSCFANAKDARYLGLIAGGKTNGLDVRMIPCPPGWKGYGDYWLVFSKVQDIEAEHDAVYRVSKTPLGFTIGSEVSESDASLTAKIVHADTSVKLNPSQHSVSIHTKLSLKDQGGRALVFRLNLPYHLVGSKADPTVIPRPKTGDWVRAGGLLVRWTKEATASVELNYVGVPAAPDQVNSRLAYLTAWWIPSLGRLPHTSNVTITGAPKGWVVRSEGNQVKPGSWECKIPIAFPKVVAGKYVLAAETKDKKGRAFRSWQFAPVDKKRGEFDVKRMSEMAQFYEEKLTPWPFPGYECFDGEDYYGIESYSFTLLSPGISSRYVGHEMGHTYFGGLAPCAYVKDTWNEGVTTYVDDVLTGRQVDRPLERAFEDAVRIHTPLSKMSLAWGDEDESYWRGAYVMKMLEAEIGPPNVLTGLRGLIKGQVGKETNWASLRPYFEAAGGKKLDWFWQQWIDGGVFPTVEIVSATQRASPTAESSQATVVSLRLKQSGTAPFRLRFPIVATNGELEYPSEVVMDTAEMTVEIKCDTPVRSVVFRPLGYTLARTGEPMQVNRP